MKKLFLILTILGGIGFFAIPAFAATAVPWNLKNITDTFITPNLVNGTTLGIYVTASSTVASTTFQSNGNVGIGTTTAAQLLTLSANDSGTTLTSAGLPSLSVINSNTTANNTADIVFKTADTSGATVVGTKFASVFTSHTPSAVSADLAFLTRSAGTLGERMRLTSTGLLGIGATATGAKLEVMGTTTDGTGNLFIGWNSSGKNVFTIANNGSTTIGNFGVCNTTSALTTNAAGTIICGAITGSGGGITSVTATFPIASSGGSTPNITFGGLSTSTPAVLGNIPYFSGVNTFANVATSSIGAGTGLSFSGTSGFQVGGTNGTFSVNTTQNITTLSNLSTAGTLNNTASGVLYSTATSTVTTGSGLTYTGTMGSEIGGVSGTLSVSGLTGTNFANANANTVFANGTGASGAPSFIATSTFFGAPTPGFGLAFLNGAWVGAATTTDSCSSGVTCTYAGGVNTFTNSGVTSIVAGTNITVSGATGAVTVNCPSCTGGGGGTYPFTPSTDGGINTSATSTPIQGTNPGLGLDVSNTSWYGIGGKLFAYGSTTNNVTILGLNAGGTSATTSATMQSNVAIGNNVLKTNGSGGGPGIENVAIGQASASFLAPMQTNVNGSNNTAIGGTFAANSAGAPLSAITNGQGNTAVGSGALSSLITASRNTAIGALAARVLQNTGTDNVIIGYQSANALSSGIGNVAIGASNGTALGLTSGGNNIAIGFNLALPSGTNNGQLNIGAILFGTGNSTTGTTPGVGKIGIGTTTPWGRLSISANSGDTNQNLFIIGSTTATAAITTLFQIGNTGHVTTSGPAPTCTTNCTFVAGNDNAFRITTSAAVSSETVTFAQPWGTLAPICQATEGGNTATPIVIAASTTPTAVVLTNSALSSKDIDVICQGIQ